jgi:hypothetical protein
MKIIGKEEVLTVKYMKIHTWYVMVCYGVLWCVMHIVSRSAVLGKYDCRNLNGMTNIRFFKKCAF